MGSPNHSQNLPASPHVTPVRSQSESSFQEDKSDNDFDFSDFKNEQEIIDKGLNFLLNFKHKKPVGRPPSSSKTSTLKVPDFVNPTLKSITNISELHPGVLLDYLIKLNSLNKKILKHCSDLHKKVNSLDAKFEENVQSLNVSPPEPVASPLRPNLLSRDNIDTAFLKQNEEIELRLDNIKQRSLSSVLTCSGEVIDEICDAAGNNRDLITKFTDKVSPSLPVINRSDIVKITPVGRDKKVLKIVCASNKIKNNILKTARERKLPNIYFSEFLTKYRYTLYYKLRQLKKTNIGLIHSTYTRDGNLFCKLVGDSRFYIIRRNQDLVDLKIKLEDQQRADVTNNIET